MSQLYIWPPAHSGRQLYTSASIIICIEQRTLRSGPLQELRELRAGEDRLGLLERLDLLVPGRLADLEVLQYKVAAGVQVRVLVGQLLEFRHHRLLLRLGLHLVRLRLRLL